MAKQENQIERSRQAQSILDNEVFSDALIMLQEQYKNLWAMTSEKEQDERERIWMALKLIPEFERQLRIIIENGVIKENQIIKIKQNIA